MTKVRTARLLVLVAIAGSVLVGCVDVDGRQATHVAWGHDHHGGSGEVATWALLGRPEGQEG